MSDTDTSCYVNTLHRNTPTLTDCTAQTLFSLFPMLQTNGTRRKSQGYGRKKPHSGAAQDFFKSGLAQPLTLTECGVTFASWKRENSLVFVMTFHFQHIDLHHFIINIVYYTVMGGNVARPCNIPTAL